MFALDRETAIIVALVACVAASYYIYTDLRKSKEDITKITKFLDSVTSEPPPDMVMRGAPPSAAVQVQSQQEVPPSQNVDIVTNTAV
tara:strand:- start:225 stop:485 length:261 start_codon:yes stop_codon:yes gene_type:complete